MLTINTPTYLFLINPRRSTQTNHVEPRLVPTLAEQDARWHAFVGSSTVLENHVLPTHYARTLSIPLHVQTPTRTLCRFSFSHMFDNALPTKSNSDFQVLCKHYDVVFLDELPLLASLKHDEVRRFINFVDQLYDANRELYIYGEFSLDRVMRVDTGIVDMENQSNSKSAIHEMELALKRTRSRLNELVI